MGDTQQFLELIESSPNSEHTFQTIPIGGGTPLVLHGSYLSLAGALKAANEQGAGIFVCINETDGCGRKAANITRVRALFLDLDGAPIEPVMTAGLRPHMIVESSPNKWHAYWLVDDCPLDQFKALQRAIANVFNGDPAVCDLPRVMRLPGFYHQKQGRTTGILTEPYLTHIDQLHETPRYSIEQVVEGLKLNVSPQTKHQKAKNERFNINTQLVDGQRTKALTQFCGRLVSQGCDDVTAMQMLQAWNDSQCNPPLSDDKLASTYKSIQRTNERNSETIHPVIADLNKSHAVVSVGGKTVVLRENGQQVDFIGANDFKLLYANKRVEGASMGHYWLTHPQRRTYMEVVFNPAQDAANDSVYNLWRGFSLEPKQGDCSLYLEHLKTNICSGNDEYYSYLLNWMAHAVQHPDTLPGVAIVLKGEQGTGKGVAVSNFGRVFGRHFKHLTSREAFLGRFNGHLQDAVMLFADEVYWAGGREQEGILKTLITEPRRQFEHKGKGVVELDNYCRVMMATNNEWAVPAGLEERRFFVLSVGNSKRQDTTYFSAVQKQMDNGGREALLHMLLEKDISNVDIRRFPRTNALAEQKLLSLRSVEKWWFDCLLEGAIGPCDKHANLLPKGTFTAAPDQWPCYAPTTVLYGYYATHAKQAGERYLEPQAVFSKTLKRLANISKKRCSVDGLRINGYLMHSVDRVRQQFEAAIGQSVDWNEGGGA